MSESLTPITDDILAPKDKIWAPLAIKLERDNTRLLAQRDALLHAATELIDEVAVERDGLTGTEVFAIDKKLLSLASVQRLALATLHDGGKESN